MSHGKSHSEVDVPSTIKRNLTKDFDEVSKVKTVVPLKKVKIEECISNFV
jgi:hypothetical protein